MSDKIFQTSAHRTRVWIKISFQKRSTEQKIQIDLIAITGPGVQNDAIRLFLTIPPSVPSYSSNKTKRSICTSPEWTNVFNSTFQVPSALGHGRLIEPPSRASMWRFGFNNPPDFDDTAGYCGGITVSLQLRFQNSRDWMERRIKSNHWSISSTL